MGQNAAFVVQHHGINGGKGLLSHNIGNEIVQEPTFVDNPEFLIDCKCNRVPVLNGHTESVFIETVKETTVDEIINVWGEFKSATEDAEIELPNAPKQAIIYYKDKFKPQPRIDLEGNGMSTLVGGLEKTEFSNGFKFTSISHNTELGAGRGGVLSAEYLIAKKYI